MIEAMAQLGGAMMLEPGEFSRKTPYLAGIDKAKFRRPVVPGDRFDMEVTMLRHKRNIGWVLRRGDSRRAVRLFGGADVLDRVRSAHVRRRLERAARRRSPMLHPTAIVHPNAEIGKNAEIGPYCIVGENVTIGARTVLQAHVVVNGWTEIGDDCQIYPFATIGAASQDRKYAGERAYTRIGSRTTLREYVSIQRATGHDEVTAVGDDCLLLAYVHIAHNCIFGNGVTMSNLAQLAGHVQVGDYVDDRRPDRHPPVHARRPLRDGRRHEQAHQRRAAVFLGRRQSVRSPTASTASACAAPRSPSRIATRSSGSTSCSTIRSSTSRRRSKR